MNDTANILTDTPPRNGQGQRVLSCNDLLCPSNFPVSPTNQNQKTIEPKTINNSRAISYGTAALVSPEQKVERLLTRPHTQTAGDGKNLRIRNPEHRAKAERFWSALSQKRKQPGNCCRCGKPHDGEYRQCDPCRVRVAALKAKRQAKGMTLAECVAMVKQCRREVTKLRELLKQVRRTKWNAYNRGYTAGNKHGLEVAKYHGTLPEISKQELAQINHAYDHS